MFISWISLLHTKFEQYVTSVPSLKNYTPKNWKFLNVTAGHWKCPTHFKYQNQQLSVASVWSSWCNHRPATSYHASNAYLYGCHLKLLFHSSIGTFSSSTRVDGWNGSRKIATCSMFQTVSIGLRSDEHARQSIRMMVSYWRYSSTTLARRGRALSSIMMNWVQLHQSTVCRRRPGYHPCRINRSSFPLSRCVGLLFHLCWYQPKLWWSILHSGHVQTYWHLEIAPHVFSSTTICKVKTVTLLIGEEYMILILISPVDVLVCPVQMRLFVKSGQGNANALCPRPKTTLPKTVMNCLRGNVNSNYIPQLIS